MNEFHIFTKNRIFSEYYLHLADALIQNDLQCIRVNYTKIALK